MWVGAAVINRWEGGCVPPTRTLQLWFFNDTCSATASGMLRIQPVAVVQYNRFCAAILQNYR